jgi:hypothetical protein
MTTFTDASLVGGGTVASQLRHFSYFGSVIDDASISLLSNTSGGFGFAQLGDGEHYGFFSFTSAGVVTLISNSTNCVGTDTDNKFCIFDGGTTVTIKNRTGSTKNLMVLAFYE